MQKGGEFDKTIGKRKEWKRMEPQVSEDNVIRLKHYYSTSKRDPGFRKRISWFENSPELLKHERPTAGNRAVAEYVSNWPKATYVHGNAKSGNEYMYVLTSRTTKESLKTLAETAAPHEVHQKLVLNDSVDAPRH